MIAVKILGYIFSFTCIIPAVIGFRNFNKLTKDLKAVTLYTFVCVLFEIPSNYYFYHRMNNLFILHFYTVIEFVFLAYIYSFHLDKVLSRGVIFTVAIVFSVLSILNSIFIQPIQTFNSYARCAEILLVMFFALCYVYALIMRDEQRQLKHIPMFWINTAVLIYFTAVFFLYLVSNNMISLSRDVGRIVWKIHEVLLAGYYLTIARALWVQVKR